MGNVWCIGRNYAKHAHELGNAVPSEPIVFLKPSTAIRGLQPAPVAFSDETFDHECELVLVLGRPVALGAEAGWEVVRGVAVGIDLTRRAVQARCKERGLPWWPAKGFAGSAIVSPEVDLREIPDPSAITFSLQVEGEPRQLGRVEEMIFPVPALLAHLARYAPLEAGDLVFTGTPEGVGPLRVGDRFTLSLGAGGQERRYAGTL